MKSSTAFTIGELAGRFGLPTHVLRHWETAGLLSPPRTAGGRRYYGPADVTRIALILQGKELGFSLEQIHEVLGTDDPLARRAALRAQHVALTERITSAEAARQALAHAIDCTSEDFFTCPHFRRKLADRIPAER
ncbi:MerR family transcriptional regulator [Amycolatopsis nigrescens]|uniref:MerR family transcriptional regulator n=1 Tax=Amycolatopsis nigrescens TaxID=381445 RepID=UPI0003614BF9|nr:MerR family transcriptional regulator [Amycolatopsis nigrescens]